MAAGYRLLARCRVASQYGKGPVTSLAGDWAGGRCTEALLQGRFGGRRPSKAWDARNDARSASGKGPEWIMRTEQQGHGGICACVVP